MIDLSPVAPEVRRAIESQFPDAPKCRACGRAMLDAGGKWYHPACRVDYRSYQRGWRQRHPDYMKNYRSARNGK